MKPSWSIASFAIGTVLMLTLYGNELLLLAIMSIATAGALAIDHWKNVKPFFLAMIVGGICENLAVFLGAWSYSNANYLYAPLWLPVGWGMATIFLEEAFGGKADVRFSKRSIAMAFGGTFATGIVYWNELLVFALFVIATICFFRNGFFRMEEIRIGLTAAVFGTVMESVCIIAGNWHYTSAMFGTPVWLPLCWFNAFLIMRRIIRM